MIPFGISSVVLATVLATSPLLHLLLLEDDHDLGQAVAEHLRAAGHRVQWCLRIAVALAAPAPDMALLDLHLPDGDGLDLLRAWRAAGQAWPVIVLTARDQVSDRIRGLQAGADDYLVKPFDLDELLARVNAVSRRMPALAVASPSGESAEPCDPGLWSIDLDACTARPGG